jgi:hypothetical protein
MPLVTKTYARPYYGILTECHIHLIPSLLELGSVKLDSKLVPIVIGWDDLLSNTSF